MRQATSLSRPLRDTSYHFNIPRIATEGKGTSPSTSLRRSHILTNLPDPFARLTPKQLQLRRWQIDLVRKEAVLHAPRIWRRTLDNAYGRAAMRAHAALHWFARASVGILVVRVCDACDGDLILWDKEGV